MNENLVKPAATVAILGALGGACTLQTEGGGENEEPVATSTAELADDVGATFEQVLSHNQPWNKSTNVCEMTIPNVDPNYSVEIAALDVVDQAPGANVFSRPTWSGHDIHLEDVGKEKDRLDITGCSQGGACRLTIRLTVKGNDPNSFLGCGLRADLQEPRVGYVGVSEGNRLVATTTAASAPPKAIGRQKLLLNEDATRVAQQCTARVFSPGTPQPVPFGAHFEYWVDGVDLGKADGWTTGTAPPFPTSLPLDELDGLAIGGRDADNTMRAKHIFPFGVGHVPGTYFWCSAIVATRLDPTPIHTAELNYDTDPEREDRPGMMFERQGSSESTQDALVALFEDQPEPLPE